MQRFLLFILIVIFTCIVLARIFMAGYEPVDYLAALNGAGIPVEKPVFNEGKLMLEISWSRAQVLYLCKLIILVVIVLVAVLNYRSYVSEQEES